MTAASVCEYLIWDSEFFGRRIARVTAERLTESTVQQIRTWCDLQRIDCLYFLADPNDSDTTILAENEGYHLTDIRLSMAAQLEKLEPKQSFPRDIRLGNEGDIPALCTIARVSHSDSRFYHDPNFPRPLCEKLYEIWIKKSLTGYADAVLVPEDDGEPEGYISCHAPIDGTAHIGLFAIAEKAQGRGVAEKLLMESLRWFWHQGVMEVTVVTQGRNVRAQRLYQKCGFRTRSLQLWYHYWPCHPESGVL